VGGERAGPYLEEKIIGGQTRITWPNARGGCVRVARSAKQSEWEAKKRSIATL
jgi:hypothetical protein